MNDESPDGIQIIFALVGLYSELTRVQLSDEAEKIKKLITVAVDGLEIYPEEDKEPKPQTQHN